jgi:hypothetical protein
MMRHISAANELVRMPSGLMLQVKTPPQAAAEKNDTVKVV